MSKEFGYTIYTHYDFCEKKLKETAEFHDKLWQRLAQQWVRYNPGMNGAPIIGAGFYINVLKPRYKVPTKMFLIRFYQKECMRWEATREVILKGLIEATGLDVRYDFGRLDEL